MNQDQRWPALARESGSLDKNYQVTTTFSLDFCSRTRGVVYWLRPRVQEQPSFVLGDLVSSEKVTLAWTGSNGVSKLGGVILEGLISELMPKWGFFLLFKEVLMHRETPIPPTITTSGPVRSVWPLANGPYSKHHPVIPQKRAFLYPKRRHLVGRDFFEDLILIYISHISSIFRISICKPPKGSA